MTYGLRFIIIWSDESSYIVIVEMSYLSEVVWVYYIVATHLGINKLLHGSPPPRLPIHIDSCRERLRPFNVQVFRHLYLGGSNIYMISDK